MPDKGRGRPQVEQLQVEEVETELELRVFTASLSVSPDGVDVEPSASERNREVKGYRLLSDGTCPLSQVDHSPAEQRMEHPLEDLLVPQRLQDTRHFSVLDHFIQAYTVLIDLDGDFLLNPMTEYFG